MKKGVLLVFLGVAIFILVFSVSAQRRGGVVFSVSENLGFEGTSCNFGQPECQENGNCFCIMDEIDFLEFDITFGWVPPNPEMPICVWADPDTMPPGADFPTTEGFGEVTSTFTWTPNFCQAGPYQVIFQGGEFCFEPLGQLPVGIEVSNLNRPPFVEIEHDISVQEGELAQTFVQWGDPDASECNDDSFAISAGQICGVSFCSEFIEFEPDFGEFQWQTDIGDEGDYEVSFAVVDSHGDIEIATLIVEVTAGENACPADFNGDGVVGPFDLAQLLASWGECPVEGECPADFNGDGVVGPFDLAQLLASWGPCSSNPQVELTFPGDNSVGTGIVILDAAILSDDFDAANAGYIAFEYFDGESWQVIEDLTDNALFYEWDTQWDVEFLPSGDILVRIVLVDVKGNTWEDVINIAVNEAPTSDMQIDRKEFEIIFDGSLSSDEDGSIESYSWLIDTDDPFFLEGEIVSISVFDLPIGTEFGVTLTTVDNDGGENPVHSLVTIPCEDPKCVPVVAPKTCGCSSMDILDSGTTDKYDMYWMPAGNNDTLGHFDTINMSQAGPFQVVHNFVVKATLNERSNPELCEEGQRIKRSGMIAGIWFNKSKNESIVNASGGFGLGPKIECGFGGAKWCDDGYHKPSSTKKHKDQSEINWVDGPGIDRLRKAWITGGGFAYKANFEAQVNGDRSCKCNWDVIIEVNSTGSVTKSVVENKVCT